MHTFTSETMNLARRYWGMELVRGIVAIIFGLLAIFWPHLTFTLFIIIFGFYAIIEGLVLCANAFSQRAGTMRRTANQSTRSTLGGEQAIGEEGASRANWGTLLAEGLLSIICGLLALILPTIVGRLVLYAVAAWAVFKGVGFLLQASRRGWVMGVIGVLAILLAIILFFNPLTIIRTFLWLVGIFSLIMGILLVTRGLQHNLSKPTEPSY